MELKKQIGLLGVFSIASGAMISSGLFVLPGIVYAYVGPAVILAYILAGILILPAMFAKAELATAMPRAGGSYYFIERSMGSAAGTIGGFASWFSLSLKSAFALVGIGAFATLISPGIPLWEIKLIAIGFCVFFTVLNLVSVKFTSRIQTVLVLVLIGLLVIYIVRGAMSLDVQRYTPFMPFGADAMFAAAGMVFISFGGLTKITSVSEEIKNPSRNIPFGMILSFCVILLIYGLGVFVTVGLLDGQELAGSLTPISTAGRKIFGTFGTVVMAVAAILAFISTANAGILSASRFPAAMSRDQLLPRFFSSVNKRFKTPHFSIISTGAFMVAVVLFLDLENLVKVASAMKILLFIFMLLACITMRESRILNYKPAFPSPLYPWMMIAGLICYGFFLYKIGMISLIATGGFILASIVWHRIYVRKRASRKSALMHVVERVISKEIAGGSLVSELREVLEARDELVEDQFGRLVRKCEIIDLVEQTTLEEFFTVVTEKVAERLDVDAGEMADRFMTRENQSTTVLRPGLAIPHITIDGEKNFELVIVRCEAGILFSEESEPVYAAFILVGTPDERNFHLRALSAIAQIVQDPDFDKNWLRAKSIEELRDIVSLAKRHRHEP